MIVEVIIQVTAAIATAGSVLWAIYVFKKTEERRLFAKTRENLSNIKYLINEIDSQLGQDKFALISHKIVGELKELKPEEWSLQQFSDFLIETDNHDLIANAVHVGRLNCDFLDTIELRMRELDQSIVSLKEKLPFISESLNKLSFYIERPASLVFAPTIFDVALGKPEIVKDSLLPRLDKHEFEAHYFTEIANYCAAFPESVMSADKFGQKTFDLAESIIQILIQTYSAMTDVQLRQASFKQKSNESKIKDVENEHAVEDVVEYLKFIKSDFSENSWDMISESKGKIIQLISEGD